MLYGDWIHRRANAYPLKEALVDTIGQQRYSYQTLDAAVTHTAAVLLENHGITKGDRVAVLAHNCVEVIVLFFAVGRLGAILVPLSTRLTADELRYFIEDSHPKTLFYGQAHEAVVADMIAAGARFEKACLDETLSEVLNRAQRALSEPQITLPEIDIRPADPLLIIYTSGTTGRPKGVVLTHGMLTWNAINSAIGWQMGTQDRTVLNADLYYTAGWNVFTLPLIYCGGTSVLIQGFDAPRVLELIEQEKLTFLFGVPTMFQMMQATPGFDTIDLSSLRFVISGGAPLPGGVRQVYWDQKKIHICEGYGLTEVGPNNFMGNGKPGTVGHPMPHVDVRLISAEGQPVAVGEDGELLLRGDHMCAGYWQNPEATAQAIQQGWFHTGDLARIDADGHLSIVGRIKDMLISGGINVYPAEIEKIIETHPLIEAAAVIGVPDEKWGEVGKAILELTPGSSMTLEVLQEFLKDRLAKYKLPRYMAVVEAMPRTASGKIQKHILKKKIGAAHNEAIA